MFIFCYSFWVVLRSLFCLLVMISHTKMSKDGILFPFIRKVQANLLKTANSVTSSYKMYHLHSVVKQCCPANIVSKPLCLGTSVYIEWMCIWLFACSFLTLLMCIYVCGHICCIRHCKHSYISQSSCASFC